MGSLVSTSSEASGSAESIRRHTAMQVNDSLFQLHSPPGTPSVEIIFFHGLQLGDYTEAHLSTWESGDGSCVWPQKWLVEVLPTAHVLSVSYSRNMEAWKSGHGGVDMYSIGENLVSDLMQQNIGQVPHCPVVLVGHSTGGLVIKQICLQAHERLHMSQGTETMKLERFLDNVKGIFYYATPHHGSPALSKLSNGISNPFLDFSNTLNQGVGRLNDKFSRLAQIHPNWTLAGLGEALPTNLGPLKGVMVVPEASSRGDNFNVVEGADHFSICKPASKTSRSFVKLVGFLKEIANNTKLELERNELARRELERNEVERRSRERNELERRSRERNEFERRSRERNELERRSRERNELERRSRERNELARRSRERNELARREVEKANELVNFRHRTARDTKDKEESRRGRKYLEELQEKEDMDGDAFEWYDDPLTWEKMCDPVMCSDGRTYDRWTIIDQRISRSPYDPSICIFGILCDDVTTRSRLFRAFPEQELKFRQRRKRYREEALQDARAHPIEFESAVEKLSNVLKWLPLDKECQVELMRILS